MSKKQAPPPKQAVLGRPGNHLKMGIVGLPNVGKSTLFNTLTNMGIPAENFPFCTIDPNESRCNVPDERFDHLCKEFKPAKEIPAFLSITDIAGLVRNAHGGEGLGNAFLSHIRAVDGIYQCIRIFDNEEIIHVEGEVDPIRDLEIIHDELRLKDIETLEKKIESLAKIADKVDKTKRLELDFLKGVLLPFLQEGKDVRTGEWKSNEIEWINPLFLLSAKPIVYLINMSERDFIRKRNKWLVKIKQWVDEHVPGAPMIPFCASLESTAATLSGEDNVNFWKEQKGQSAIPKIITTGYHSLNLIHFFTCGADEVRCWTVQEGAKAPDAAGVIHTDFQKGFICAEVYSYADFVECGSEAAVKAGGKYKQQGKNYVVVDGDIMFFKANTGGGLKKKK